MTEIITGKVNWDWWSGTAATGNPFKRTGTDVKIKSSKTSTRNRIKTFGWRNTAKFYFTEFKDIFNVLASVTILPKIPNKNPITQNPIQSEIADQLNNINNPKDEKQKKIIKVEEPEEDSDAATKNYVDKLGVFTSSGDVVSNGFITVTDSAGTSRKLMVRA